ncbi:phosphoadenosine phosphosulfate reductase family protein [Pantoea agglomerans]|uniref:phosphoadenosine phosphosulfate reductase domain-containing protein n=1 Tax=Enterobacter agglomerans TaxID=549 RepID=UPI00241373AB|nr:phosphoadenosine phosphosulfate reductase family protein [Pantoea agglomerans]
MTAFVIKHHPLGWSVTDERIYHKNAVNIVSVSGGKDSLAQWLLALLNDVDPVRVFADTGHEHPQTMEYLDYLENRLGPIRRVRADFSERILKKRDFIARVWPQTLVTECGMTHEEAAATIERALAVLYPTGVPFLDLCMWKGRFPSTKVRFCTFELKHEPIKVQVVDPLISVGKKAISWQGVRAQESPERALLAEWEEGFDIGPRLAIYRPILHWQHEDVFRLARHFGVKPNPLYEQGCSRVGCMPCIHARKSELAEIFQRWPEEISRVAEWEKIVAACSRRGNSTFFPSTQDPVKSERRNDFVTLQTHGIETYRDWALTTRGGRQFDLLAESSEPGACLSHYAGVCE